MIFLYLLLRVVNTAFVLQERVLREASMSDDVLLLLLATFEGTSYLAGSTRSFSYRLHKLDLIWPMTGLLSWI